MYWYLHLYPMDPKKGANHKTTHDLPITISLDADTLLNINEKAWSFSCFPLQCLSGHLLVKKLNIEQGHVWKVLMLTSSAGGDVRGFGDSRRQETSIVIVIIVPITITMITVIIAIIVVIIAIINITIIITRVSASGRSREPRTGARPNHWCSQDSSLLVTKLKLNLKLK